MQSAATVAADHWTARAFVPFARLGLREGEIPSGWRIAVCRYDRSLGPEMFSSTARNGRSYGCDPEPSLGASA